MEKKKKERKEKHDIITDAINAFVAGACVEALRLPLLSQSHATVQRKRWMGTLTGPRAGNHRSLHKLYFRQAAVLQMQFLIILYRVLFLQLGCPLLWR